MLSLQFSANLLQSFSLQSSLLQCQLAPLHARWQEIHQRPQLLAENCERLLLWLPSSTRQALAEELYRDAEQKTKIEPVVALSSQTEKGVEVLEKKRGQLRLASKSKAGTQTHRITANATPLTEPAKEVAVRLIKDVETAAGLAFLSLLLSPLISQDTTSRTAPAHNEALMQLELICALLLQRSPHFSLTEPLLNSTGNLCEHSDVSLFTSVQARVVSGSLELWMQFYLYFFFDQLHCERARVAALVATASHLTQSRFSRSVTSRANGGSNAGMKLPSAFAKTENQQREIEVKERDKLLQKYPLMQKRHPSHFFAQKILEAATRIANCLSNRYPSKGDFTCLGTTETKQNLLQGRKTQQLRKPVLSALSKAKQLSRSSVSKRTPGRRGEQQRRERFGRKKGSNSTSSASTLTSSSTYSVSSSSASTNSEGNEGAGVDDTISSQASASTGASVSDGDIPLVALARYYVA